MSTKLRESWFHLQRTVKHRGPFAKPDFSSLEGDLSEYRSVTLEYGGFELIGSRAFSVGCGQRPYRLLYLSASGVDIYGTDLDVVMLGFHPGDLARSFRSNGAERAVKTSVRYVTSDVFENRRLRKHLAELSGAPFDWPLERIATGSAGDPTVWPDEPVDFVHSEDVFEHIPVSELSLVCGLIAERLSDRGVALIRPNVFTGIQGGHNIEYYDLDPDRKRGCPPWDHLREYRFPASTYLNGLSRADYRELLSDHFAILDERVMEPWKGQAFMTDSIREELAEYSDDELFSNHVRWVVKART